MEQNYIAIGSTNGEIVLYDINNLTSPVSFYIDYQFDNIINLEYSSKYKLLMSSCEDETFCIFKTSNDIDNCLENLVSLNKITTNIFFNESNDTFILEFGDGNIEIFNSDFEKINDIKYQNSYEDKSKYYINIGNLNNLYYYACFENNFINIYNIYNNNIEYSFNNTNNYIQKVSILNNNMLVGIMNNSQIFITNNNNNVNNNLEAMFE